MRPDQTLPPFNPPLVAVTKPSGPRRFFRRTRRFYEPARLAHLDDGYDRAILVQGDEGPAQVVRLGHLALHQLYAATKSPFLAARPIASLGPASCERVCRVLPKGDPGTSRWVPYKLRSSPTRGGNAVKSGRRGIISPYDLVSQLSWVPLVDARWRPRLPSARLQANERAHCVDEASRQIPKTLPEAGSDILGGSRRCGCVRDKQ